MQGIIITPMVLPGTQGKPPCSSLVFAQEQIGKTVFAQKESNNISQKKLIKSPYET